MELDIIKKITTWNDAAGSINVNFAKLKESIDSGQLISLDDEMSNTSENAVQNKVIKEYIDLHPQYEIVGKVDVPDYNGGGGGTIILDTEMSDTSENGVQNKVIKQYVDRIKEDYATKGEVSQEIADLINGAPTTLDTLGEIAEAFEQSHDIIQALDQAIGQKANQSALDELSAVVSALRVTLNNINAWYSKLANLIVEDNGNVLINTNLIVNGDTASE